jgi:D-cysteine desulfhydrase
MATPRKLGLAHLPTPIIRHDALDALVGTQVWVKRDDATGGAEAGNKIRKLEYLLADAVARGARCTITCGGAQSNHARACAIASRRLGLRPVLLLRSDPPPAKPWQGNLLLDQLLGAEIRFITPAQYAERDAAMEEVAQECAARGEHAYVIPEGGSNGLGALGYVDAMAEIRGQLDADKTGLPTHFGAVVHACGSGGTAAGCVVGAARHAIAEHVIAMAVCDDALYFTQRIEAIARDAESLLETAGGRAQLRVVDAYKGPAYGVPSTAQLHFIESIARATGLLLDPVYTGKALFGLSQLAVKPSRVLFLHTGGLPGLLAEASRFSF